MLIDSLELNNFRNYKSLSLKLRDGVNIFYGDNAQGKTNILDAVYLGCTSKSHKLSKDKDMINFDSSDAHIRINLTRKDMPYRIDMHLKKNSSKGIAVNGVPIRRSSELFGIANVVIFAPEDLDIIKDGPSERRRFLNMELCQLNKLYVYNLISYSKVINQKNKLLKEYEYTKSAADFIDIYNEQLVKFGSEIIRLRRKFTDRIGRETSAVHEELTEGREKLELDYEANTDEERFEAELKRHRDSELRLKMSLVGPHRDDLVFRVNGTDLRNYGSQGQHRTAVLSLKMAEINIVKEITGERPLLLLDDVLSELDRKRQTKMLNTIREGQTLITCTGLDDFVDNRFHIDKLFLVRDGMVEEKREEGTNGRG